MNEEYPSSLISPCQWVWMQISHAKIWSAHAAHWKVKSRRLVYLQQHRYISFNWLSLAQIECGPIINVDPRPPWVFEAALHSPREGCRLCQQRGCRDHHGTSPGKSQSLTFFSSRNLSIRLSGRFAKFWAKWSQFSLFEAYLIFLRTCGLWTKYPIIWSDWKYCGVIKTVIVSAIVFLINIPPKIGEKNSL